jgi:hypothetical protein
MRGLFTLLGFALVAFLGLGYYFNWYTITRTPTDEAGHTKISVDLNGKKVKDDISKGVKASADKIDGVMHPKTASAPTSVPATGTVQPPPGS